MNRLSWFGIVATLVYFSLLLSIIYPSRKAFYVLEPNAWGDFMAGTLGPVALFWLVLGYFQQGTELQNSIATLKLQASELNSSVSQQRRLAEATQAQLRQEKEHFEQQIQFSLERNSAQFMLKRMIDRSRNSDDEIYSKTVRISLVNVGAPAAHVDCGLWSNEYCHKYLGRAFWDTGQSDEISLQLDSPSAVNKKLDRISSFNGKLRLRYHDRNKGLIDRVFIVNERLTDDSFEKLQEIEPNNNTGCE